MKWIRKKTYLKTGLFLSAFSLLGAVGNAYATVNAYATPEWSYDSSCYYGACHTDGKFGDNCSGYIYTTSKGSYWYAQEKDDKGRCGTTPHRPIYVRPDLPIGTVGFTTGDFNGDGLDDLIVTTESGSYWDFNNGDYTWDMVHYRPDLTLGGGPYGGVEFAVGDFNGDGLDDLIITTPSDSNLSGATGYYSNGDGTWTKFWGTNRIFGSHMTEMNSGDFDGDGLDDLVMIHANGIYVWYSNGGWRWEKHSIGNAYQVAGAGDKSLRIYSGHDIGVGFNIANEFTRKNYQYVPNGARGSFRLIKPND